MTLSQLSKQSVRDRVSPEEWKVRVDLAACYRLMAHLGLTDLIYNHITARVPGTDHQFLINPYGLLYTEITASNLHKIDADGNLILPGDSDLSVNPAGFVIHSAIHMAREDAGCVIHTHSRAATAVAAMKCGLLPISQYALMFTGKVSSHAFEGVVVDHEERQRLVADLHSNNVMMLNNHGTLAIGRDIPQAFLRAYNFENACRIQVDAMAAKDLILVPDAIAAQVQRVASDPRFLNGTGLEWGAMLRLLDRSQPDYAS